MRYAPATLGLLALCMTPALAAAPAQKAGLGLTVAQLEDADLTDAAGNDIGDVEHVVLDKAGRAIALIVEIDRPDPQPDKLARIGMAGLRAVPEPEDAGDYDLVTAEPVARLLALPDWRPR